MPEQTHEMIEQLRLGLREARKSNDAVKMRTLQALIARIDNAEAVPNDETDRVQGNQFFAGAKSGIGSTEVPRKELTAHDIQKAIEDEIAEIDNALAEFVDCPEDIYAAELEKKKEILMAIEMA